MTSGATARVQRAIPAGLFLATVLILAVSYPREWSGREPVAGARSNMAYVFSESFAEGEGFRHPLRHFDRLPPDIAQALTPRDAARIGSETVPKDFAGVILVHGVLQAVWRPLALLLAPLLAGVCVLLVLALARALLGSALPLPRATWFLPAAVALLWLFHPTFAVHGAYVYSSDMLSLSAMLAAVLFFVRFWREGHERDFVLMCASFGAAAIMRYPNVLLAVPIGSALLAGRRVTLRRILLAAAVVAPFLGVVLAFNAVVYGSATTTGYSLGSNLLASTAGLQQDPLFQMVPRVVAKHFKYYVLLHPMMLAPQLLGAAAAVIAWRRARSERSLLAALLGICAVLGLYYVGREGLGSTDPRATASFLRYMLPVSALLTIFVVWGIAWAARARPPIATAMLAVLAVASAATAWWGPSGVIRHARAAEANDRTRAAVVQATEPDALVATRTLDPFVFPERQTLTLTYLALPGEDVEDPGGGRRRIWSALPNRDRFAAVAVAIRDRGIPFYLLERDDRTLEEMRARYVPALRAHGLRLAQVRRVEGKILFRIAPA